MALVSAEQPAGLPIAINEEHRRKATKTLVGTLEAVALAIQALGILGTINADKLDRDGRLLLGGIAALHAAAAAVAYFKGGPFQRGLPWSLLWVSGALLMPLLMANLLAPGEYGASPACVQLCGYAMPLAAVAAFYPWLSPARDFLRPSLQIALLAVVLVEPLLIIWRINGDLSSTNYQSVAGTAIVILSGLILGKGVGIMCSRAVDNERKLLGDAHRQHIDDLHTEIQSALHTARFYYDDDRRDLVLSTLNQLDEEVLTRQSRLVIAQERAPVAELIRLYRRKYPQRDLLGFRRIDFPSGMTLPQHVAELAWRALGDLLKNVLVHAPAAPVDIDIWVENHIMYLVFANDGPAFPSEILREEGTSLNRLRGDVIKMGGNLTMDETYDKGPKIVLSVPLD